MRTYLQKKLTGREGQVVTFDRNGQAVAEDPAAGIPARLHVTVIRGEVKGVITVTASCGSRRVTGTAAPGQEEVVLDLHHYGLWKVDAEEDSGTMIGTHREVLVDAVREYRETVGLEAELQKNPPAVISEACRRGAAHENWRVGDRLTLELTDGRSLALEVCGFDHDTRSDGGLAPVTFAAAACLETGAMNKTAMSNETGWEGSPLRSDLNTRVLKLLPAQWQRALCTVRKLSGSGGTYSRLTSTEDRLFLFSCEEVGGEAGTAVHGEGSRYPAFTDNRSRCRKNAQGAPTDWWLRSPEKGGREGFCCVSPAGQVETAGATQELGVIFGLCI